MHRAGLTLIVAVALGLGLLACGGGDQSMSTTTAASTTTTTTEETVDPPAKLPPDWDRKINRTAGFSIGIPPGWTIERARGGQGSVITAPDELTVVTVTADRTQGALELPLDEFATRTAEALDSKVIGAKRFEDLKVTRPAPFKDTYDAVAVRAIGRAKQTGVLERIFVVVLRREGQAAYVVVSRENAEEPSQTGGRDTVKEIIRSLRGRPPA